MRNYIDSQIEDSLNQINFTFDSRHNYEDEDSIELQTDFGWIDLKIKVFFSKDLENIIDVEIMEFYVFGNNQDEIDCNLSDKKIIDAIQINGYN